VLDSTYAHYKISIIETTEKWFLRLGYARKLIEEWRVDYNTNRPHSALGGLTPAEFAAQFEENFQEQALQ